MLFAILNIITFVCVCVCVNKKIPLIVKMSKKKNFSNFLSFIAKKF
jgi:hypothetical protein